VSNGSGYITGVIEGEPLGHATTDALVTPGGQDSRSQRLIGDLLVAGCDDRPMADLSPGSAPGGVFTLAGRPVPRVGYGMGQLARRAATAECPTDAVGLLRRAFELGVRHFDTAQFYADGLANQLLREAFRDVREQVVLATKTGARPVPLTAAQQPHELRHAVETNLRTLAADRLDVAYLRRMDHRPGLLATGDQIVPIEDQLAELAALRDEGTIAAIGLSHITLEQFHIAAPAGIACVQNIYHLLDRTFEPLLTACRDNHIAWVPYFPLGGGGGYAELPTVTDEPIVRAVAKELDATPPQIGLAWQLAHAPHTLLIPGTGSREHLAENIAAGALTLDTDTLARLDAAGSEPGRRP
jgi:aryl-alcohol dehydrogenase-like predicted oxidoreductase